MFKYYILKYIILRSWCLKNMAKRTGQKQGLIGAVGAILIGAAILLFVATLVLNSIKTAGDPGCTPGNNASQAVRNETWASLNSTIDQIKTMLTVTSILLAVMGIVIVGSNIIGYIGGGFGG